MSGPIDDGGSAFPNPAIGENGMSLRAYFAGQFAAAEIATFTEVCYSKHHGTIAARAVKQADALIAELNKKEGT